MSKLAILALRVVIALTLAGTLFVQAWMVPLVWRDSKEHRTACGSPSSSSWSSGS